jgi:PAS domain S-box-containing protein
MFQAAEGSRYLLSIKAPMRNDGGAIVGLVGISHDMTARKRTEQLLIEQQGVLELIAANRPLQECLAAITAAIGRLSMGTRGCIVLPDEDRGHLQSDHSLELPALGPDGIALAAVILCFGEARQATDWERRIAGFAAHVASIAIQREKSVAAIRDSEASFRAAVAAVEGVVWTTDATGKMTGEQPGWAALTGQNLDAYQGYGWAAAVHPEDVEATLTAWRSAVQTRSPFAFEHRVRRHDGEWRTCSIRAVPMFGKQGEMRDWVGVHTDVTVLRALERERAHLLEAERAARSDAESASRFKDEFLATLSHELRTPLTVIVGWSRLLLRRCAPESEELRKGLKLIGDNAMSQARIITDLLDMSRIAAGKMALDVKPLELGELLSQCVASQALVAAEKGVTLRFKGDPQPQRVLADPARLQQVMGNVLTNAIKFTPAMGTVEVSTRRAAAGHEIIVQDSGEGIAPEFLPHLFSRFRQADGSSARRHGGLGLGLAIVHQLVESHGGWVRADSEGLGRGARFTIWLPEAAVLAPSEPLEVLEQSGEVRLKGLRVLVVEDQPEMLEQLARVLEERGAAVTPARSAREALAILAADNERFQILVSDIGMPGMDGFELMRALRRQPAFAPERLAAVAVTAFARAEDKIRCLEAGFQAHVAKPYETGRLVAILRQLAKGIPSVREPGRPGGDGDAGAVQTRIPDAV